MTHVISGTTALCGLIGDPVGHSMSPSMQNAAFQELGLDYIYLPFRVRSEDLGKAIEATRFLNIRGLNVTVPHKVAAMQFVNHLDRLAEKIGAVNTIVNDDGALTGYNTDATGFLRSLQDRRIEPIGKNVVILGAGGASRAISFILADAGARLTILNRQTELDWAQQLARRISQAFGKQTKALELNRSNLTSALSGADMLVNATSVGMTPGVDETLVPSDLLRPDLIVYDIVYNPVNTRLLRDAKRAGAHTITGADMLVWQGALSFEHWTKHKAPVEVMKREITRLLSRRGSTS